MTTRATLAPGALLASGAFLAACSGVVTTPAYVDPSYEPAMLSYVAKAGPIYTQILGNPYGNQAEEAGRVITTALQDAQFSGRPLTFVTARPADTASPYRVVVLFNPAPAANAAKICAEPEQPQAESGDGAVSVMVAFCESDRRVSSITGHTRDAATADAPNLDRLIRQAATEIFSPRSIERRDDIPDYETS